MQRPARARATRMIITLLAGVATALANVAVLLMLSKGTVDTALLGDLYRACPPCLIYFIAAPLVVVILVALVAGRPTTSSAPGSREPQPAASPAPPSAAPALQLLGLLQQEGRFIDFLKEDIDGYSDTQVGAAVRPIHAGCRKALSERIELQRIFAAEDGSEVVVESGFDPAAVRMTGNVTGTPPFRGTLQHGGWRATKVALPQSPGDANSDVIAPAEVEIP
jgi:hypothetical protein